jgi:hypothetical protein
MSGDDEKGLKNLPQRNWLREKCKEYKEKFGVEIGKGDTPADLDESGRGVSVMHSTQAVED